MLSKTSIMITAMVGLLVGFSSFSAQQALAGGGDRLTSQQKDEVQRLLIHECGSCHGGRLTGGLGPSLINPDLAEAPEDFIRDTIEHGRPSAAMPPWKAILSPAEINYMATLVRRISQGGKL